MGRRDGRDKTASITIGAVVPSNSLSAPQPRRESDIFWLRGNITSSLPFTELPLSPQGNTPFRSSKSRSKQVHPPPRNSSLPPNHVSPPSGSRRMSPTPRLPSPRMSDFSFHFPTSPDQYLLAEGDHYAEPHVFPNLSSSTRRTTESRQNLHHEQQMSIQKVRGLQSPTHMNSDDGEFDYTDKEVVSPRDIPVALMTGNRTTFRRSNNYIPGSGPKTYRPSMPRAASMPEPRIDTRTDRRSSTPRMEPASSTLYEKSPVSSTSRPSSLGAPLSSVGPPLKPIIQTLNISTFHEILFVGAVIMAQFMALAGLGQAIGPREYISQTMGVHDPGEQSWFTSSYSLTVGTFILISGRMGDILGHKRMLLFGYFFLGVWSAFAGFSAFIGQQAYFDVCRAFQGIGSAMLVPNALALLGRAYSPGLKKNIIFSLFGAMAPWGFVVGTAASNMFAQLTWWPWLFWSYGIAAWALAAFALLVVPQALGHEAQFAGRIRKPRMDWMGSICGVAGLVLINVAFNNAPLYGWGAPNVYFVLALGAFAMIAFVWVEAHTSSPLIPSAAMNKTVGWTLLLIGLGWASFGIWIYYTWRFMLDLRELTPLTVSAQFSPALVCALLAAGLTGFMLTHTPVSFTMLVAMCAFFAGEVIAATQPVVQTYWAQMFAAVVILPFGMDMSFPAATILLSNHMPREHQGLAASLVNTIVNYSISLALGVAGSVEVGVNRGALNAADLEFGLRCALYTSLGLSGLGVLLGLVFFTRMLVKEGWKIMDH